MTEAKDSAGTHEQRKTQRVTLNLLIQVRASSIDEFKSVHCENISTGGMFLRTKERRPLGAEVFFHFTVAGGGTLIEGLGRVVRITDDGLGIEFVSLLEPSASIVQKLVDDRLRAATAP
jgi:Tfp pilus assembly protein PilZ